MNSTIPLNAFSSITVHGLVSENGVSCAQTFYRGTVKPGQQISIEFDEIIRPGGIPPRPPSNLPPPGDQHLTLSLGERLGRGRVGSVHDVTVMGAGVELPRLVVKVSQRKKSGSMAQEAWFYEELEQLQGVSIPQCYGFFQVRLPDSYRVSTWDSEIYEDEDEDKDEDKDEDEDEDEDKDEKEDEDEDEDKDEKEDEDEDEDKDKDRDELDSEDEVNYGGPAVNEEKYEKELPGQGRILSMLVLEKLGGHIPIGVPLDHIKDDVYELFNDMAHLGIEPEDIRWSNILSANNVDLETESSVKICPNHGHVHRWRLVDFDLCRKSDGTLRFIDGCNHTWLRRLFNNLVEGRVIEPWD